MKVVVVVNAPDDVRPSQTTAELIEGVARRGVPTWVCGVGDVEVGEHGAVRALGRRYTAAGERAQDLAAMVARSASPQALGQDSVVLIRTNPARDPQRAWAHDTFLDLGRMARDRGARVLNDPEGLRRASSKLYLYELDPQVRPVTAVLRSVDAVEAFVRNAPGPTVLKPLRGTQGRDVFRVEPGAPNLRQIVDVLTRSGHVMAQHFVPEAVDGDVRLVLMNGRPLQVGGAVAAVRRVPAEGEFRSNVAQGGRAVPAQMDARLQAVADAVGPLCRRDGLFLVGLDVIGGRAVELNVFSTGGLGDAGAFSGVDFIDAVVSELLQPASA